MQKAGESARSIGAAREAEDVDLVLISIATIVVVNLHQVAIGVEYVVAKTGAEG